MVKMTFDEYDKMLEIFEKVHSSGNVPVCWPTVQQVDRFYASPNQWLRFACYLHDTNPEPSNAAERYSKQNLMLFINANLELVDAD